MSDNKISYQCDRTERVWRMYPTGAPDLEGCQDRRRRRRREVQVAVESISWTVFPQYRPSPNTPSSCTPRLPIKLSPVPRVSTYDNMLRFLARGLSRLTSKRGVLRCICLFSGDTTRVICTFTVCSSSQSNSSAFHIVSVQNISLSNWKWSLERGIGSRIQSLTRSFSA